MSCLANLHYTTTISYMFSLFFSNSSNCTLTLVKKLCNKWGAADEVVKKMLQYVFSRHSIRTTLHPRFSSAFAFFPEYKSNWKRYPVLLAQVCQYLKSHFMGLFLKYCFIPILKFYHVFIDALSDTIWCKSRKAFVKIGN